MKLLQELCYSLGNVIRVAREHKHLTQSELAEKIGVTPRTLLDIENHRGNPRFNVLLQIIQILDIPADLIFHPNGIKTTSVIDQFVLEFSACSGSDQQLVASVMENLFQKSRKMRKRNI